MSLSLRVVLLSFAMGAGFVAAACTHPAEICRFEPEDCPGGRPGAFCESDKDCDGFCCTDKANCDGGMCTYECKFDDDCPPDMGCEHDMCFYLCDSDDDCAPGQTCEHGNTVCEWP